MVALQTCQRCHVKKARCSFNKGSNDSGAVESISIMELLQDISSRLACLEDKVEHIAEHVEDLMDDYHPDHDVKYPDDLPLKSMMAEFEASRLELRKTRDIYSEVLCKMAHTTFGQGYGCYQGGRVAVIRHGYASRNGGSIQSPQQVLLGRHCRSLWSA